MKTGMEIIGEAWDRARSLPCGFSPFAELSTPELIAAGAALASFQWTGDIGQFEMFLVRELTARLAKLSYEAESPNS